MREETRSPDPAGRPLGPGAAFAREIGLFGATMLVMGGIVGSGIFMNPYVVARQVGTPFLVLSAWTFGGLVALAGALVYAELASLRPAVGGQYAYLREAYGPRVAFLYGWVLLLVTQSGGMAAVAVTFARYLGELLPLPVPESAVAVLALGALTAVNCRGVRTGSDVQALLMVLKTVAILGLVAVGLLAFGGDRVTLQPALDRPPSFGLLAAFGAALVPVLFAYGGWQTSGFVMGELRRPERDMPRALLLGVAGVVFLYLSVNVVCLRALGAAGLAASTAPATDVMRLALGARGARLIAVGIAISTLGFLAQGILTAPRVYYAMARDGVFFERVGRLDPLTRVPALAIALQGAVAAVIALSGRYEQILNYVVSVDFIAMGLTGAALFVYRRRGEAGAFRVPGHPWTTAFFVLSCWAVVAATLRRYPGDSAIGISILALGLPVYRLWRPASSEGAVLEVAGREAATPPAHPVRSSSDGADRSPWG
ncbi:MAG TPA: amino acid permease [Vicinamibacteria bacterium]|nr:amino acid permease [Vicinamibacteria bacterium]